ncbi:DUF952 domain-containing protein [Streptomyces sp. NPDC096176]|uniref:DUF952 domain-containing protein n=1 Tax=Streptomyces sp. NPDC096176 TaxID=3366079 RepID=UPI0038102C16
MIFHVVPAAEWTAAPERPYAPASPAAEGFVHCSADEPSAPAVADAHYREVPELLVLVIDEARLGGRGPPRGDRGAVPSRVRARGAFGGPSRIGGSPGRGGPSSSAHPLGLSGRTPGRRADTRCRGASSAPLPGSGCSCPSGSGSRA